MKYEAYDNLIQNGNLLGYTNEKNPMNFSDSFQEARRSEWEYWFSDAQNHLTIENGELKLAIDIDVPSGSVEGGIHYPLPSGNFELKFYCKAMEGSLTTSSEVRAIVRWDNDYRHFFPLNLYYDGSKQIVRVYQSGTLYSMNMNYSGITCRYVFKGGKSFVYWTPDGGSETLVWSGYVPQTPGNFYITCAGPVTARVGYVAIRRLDSPILENFRVIPSYSAGKYNNRLLIDWLDEPPLNSNYVRNLGYIYASNYYGGAEGSGWGYAENCTWGVKDGKDAMYFNGSDSVIYSYPLNQPSDMISSAFSITSWVWADPTTSQTSIILAKTLANINYDYGLYVQANLKGLQININNGHRLTVPNCLNFREWHHVAATFDSSLASNNIKFYVDGVLVGQTTYTTPVTSSSKPIFAGSRKGIEGQFKGWLRSVRLYGKALEAGEILDDMNREVQALDEAYPRVYSSVTSSEEPYYTLKYY